MRAVDIIAKKRDGQVLDPDEIRWFVKEYTQENIPDYQAAALLMAICIRGMSRAETVQLTLAMAESGRILNLSDIADYTVDKHSSGGVGDKTTLVVLPLVASVGVPVAKMSGRGLGHTGGTLDKMEAIHGYNVNLTEHDFREYAKKHGIVLAGQSVDLAPADSKLYALRDVTATVPSLPLIASSIMSKKIAAGANGIVLDVKAGRGAFMPTVDDARKLAQMMVGIGADAGRDMVALISDMNQPLGRAVGNALEVREAIETLHGGGPEDLREHCLTIASYMVRLAGRGEKWRELDEVRELLLNQLLNGTAFAKFKTLVANQGGDTRQVDDPSQLPSAKLIEAIQAPRDGAIKTVAADKIAQAALILGAGRQKKGDAIDLAVGVMVYRRVGDTVKEGDILAEIHANSSESLEEARRWVIDAFEYAQDGAIQPLPLFYGVIEGKS